MDRELHGSLSLQALLDTGIENTFYNPKLLRQLDELRVYSESFRHGGRFSVGKTFSVANILKEINQALNGNRSQHYTIPQDRRLKDTNDLS